MADRAASTFVRFQAYGAAEVTPNDGADLPDPGAALYIGTSGDLHVVMASGDEVTLVNVPAGYQPIQVRKVFSTDTTASDIVALY